MTFHLIQTTIFALLHWLTSSMSENFKILTITHRRTSLKEIGNYVVKADDSLALKAHLEELKSALQLEEFLYLATCNRVLFFFQTDQILDKAFVEQFFRKVNPDISDSQIQRLDTILNNLKGEEATQHLFEVAASIDSLVVGEREILRQLREAYEQCAGWGLTGDNFRLFFQYLVVAAKEVYAKTRIGEKPVSVVSLAIQKLLGSGLSKNARILLIGAGQTNSLVSKFLIKYEYSNVVVFNRSIEKAELLAEKLDGQALALSKLNQYDAGFDGIIICTGSTKAVLTPELYGSMLKDDRSEKLIIDLSIPHNVAPQVKEQFPVNYIEIDDLRQLAKENLSFREREVDKARQLLEVHVEAFPKQYRQRQIELAMRSVPTEIKAIKEKAMKEVFKKEMEDLDADTLALVERMMNYMEKKCIGIPMKAAKAIVV